MPVLELRHIESFMALEQATESQPVEPETIYGISSRIPLDQPLVYRRTDPDLVGVPLLVEYHPAFDDGLVRRISYEWGGQEGNASWVAQPLERLEAFQVRYDAVQTEVERTLGGPSETRPLSSSTAGGITTWRQGATWTAGDTEVELALTFSEPLAEGATRSSGPVRYLQAHRIRATVSHGL